MGFELKQGILKEKKQEMWSENFGIKEQKTKVENQMEEM